MLSIRRTRIDPATADPTGVDPNGRGTAGDHARVCGPGIRVIRPRASAAAAAVALAAAPLLGAASRAEAQQLPRMTLDSLEVTVGSRASANLPLATRTIQVLSAEEIARAPARTIADVLAWATGADVQARSTAQADLALRGATFEQVLVLVDGVRMSDAQTGHFDLDLAVPLGEVERIEILRGPATALYGTDAVGGVVNIVTRRGGPALEAGIEAGAFGTAAATLGGAVDGEVVGVRVGGEWRRSDGHRPGTDSELVQARAALDLGGGPRPLRADIAFAARDFGARAFYTPPEAPFDEYEETRTLTASLAWAAPVPGRITLEPRLAVRRHEDDFVLRRDDPDFYRNRHTTTRAGGELVARWATNGSLRLVAGGEAHVERLESTALGDRREERAALFAELAAGRVDGASVDLGLRADWHSTFGTFVAPSIAAAVRPTAALRLRASAGRAFRAPSWTERFYRDPANIGTPALEPERAWELEAGAELEPTPGLRLGASAFLRDAEGLIDWARPTDAPAEEPWRTRNVDDATFRGLELDVRALDLLGVDWRIGASVLDFDSEASGGYTSKYALRPLTRSAFLAAERAIADGLVLGARIAHARRAGSDGPTIVNGACTPDAAQEHTRIDARVSYRWRDARIHADARNLTDAEACDVSGVPAPGRALYVGVSWALEL